jgi:uncharacterized protein (TIGR00730 family)
MSVMIELNRICVFCGSSAGVRPEYAEAARDVGRLLAANGIGLVYGGGKRGLMGELADAAIAAGGEVIGVIPRQLELPEVAHRGITELRVVESMHERKFMMSDLSDAFIGLPGGLGTMEEFFEVATWAQLGIHSKPLGLLNVCGYFDLLDQFLGNAVEEQFLQEKHRSLIRAHNSPAALLKLLRTYEPAPVPKKYLDPQNR